VSFRQECVGRSRQPAVSSGFAAVARLSCSQVEQHALEAAIGRRVTATVLGRCLFQEAGRDTPLMPIGGHDRDRPPVQPDDRSDDFVSALGLKRDAVAHAEFGHDRGAARLSQRPDAFNDTPVQLDEIRFGIAGQIDGGHRGAHDTPLGGRQFGGGRWCGAVASGTFTGGAGISIVAIDVSVSR